MLAGSQNAFVYDITHTMSFEKAFPRPEPLSENQLPQRPANPPPALPEALIQPSTLGDPLVQDFRPAAAILEADSSESAPKLPPEGGGKAEGGDEDPESQRFIVENVQIPYTTTDQRVHAERRQRPQTDVSVEPDEWEQANGKLFTYSASTCIVLAALNVQTGEGILGHFTSMKGFGSEEPLLDETIRAIRLLGSEEDTHLWLGGGGLFEGGSSEEVATDRAYALARIAELNNAAQTTVQWLEGEAVHVDLDCLNRHLLVRTEDLPPTP
jgi:hypothetical protein